MLGNRCTHTPNIRILQPLCVVINCKTTHASRKCFRGQEGRASLSGRFVLTGIALVQIVEMDVSELLEKIFLTCLLEMPRVT